MFIFVMPVPASGNVSWPLVGDPCGRQGFRSVQGDRRGDYGADLEQAEVDLAAGVLACPHCAGRPRPCPGRRRGGFAGSMARSCRYGRGARGVPRAGARMFCCCRRGACRGGPRPSRPSEPPWAPTSRGRGHRGTAADLGRPASTVHRWLRAVRGPHARWLYRQGVEHAFLFSPEVLGEVTAQSTELGDTLTALTTAAIAFCRRFGRHIEMWNLIGILTRGRLLTPHPSG